MSGNRLLGVACALVVVVAGCGGSTAQSERAALVCAAKPDRAWTAALSAPPVALSRRAALTPWALAGDGRTFFADVRSPRFSGVARVDARGGFTSVVAFDDSEAEQADGGFDGRWLVFRVYHRLDDGLADYDVFAWDSRTGIAERIGGSVSDAAGGNFPSPWRDVSVRDGFAVWTVGTGYDGAGEVHVYDLERSRDRIIRSGHPGGAFLLDDGVVAWPESPAPDRPAIMRAATVGGDDVAVPAALAGSGLVDAVATDGSALAIPEATWRGLRWSPDSSSPSTELVHAPRGTAIANSVSVSGSLVAYAIEPTAYLADANGGRAVSLPGVAYTLVDDRSVMFVGFSAARNVHPRLPVRLLRRVDLPRFPACA